MQNTDAWKRVWSPVAVREDDSFYLQCTDYLWCWWWWWRCGVSEWAHCGFYSVVSSLRKLNLRTATWRQMFHPPFFLLSHSQHPHRGNALVDREALIAPIYIFIGIEFPGWLKLRFLWFVVVMLLFLLGVNRYIQSSNVAEEVVPLTCFLYRRQDWSQRRWYAWLLFPLSFATPWFSSFSNQQQRSYVYGKMASAVNAEKLDIIIINDDTND